ncbi:MAG: hypothetical protein B6I26_00410 [Desulfobacteraceae bacterium 4572_130]|nr:MAG: hypothetical protein B6I26_00410 [Desulfobacteraceae bacterium 4572_130]
MKIKTKQFGEIDIDENRIINMPAGMPGFKDKKRYAIIQKKQTEPFSFYQSLDDQELGFILIDPLYEILYFVTLTIPKGKPSRMTANLLAPLVISITRKEAVQLILYDTSYSYQHPICQNSEKKPDSEKKT